MENMSVVDTFLELISIPSPSLREGKLARFVSRKLEELGCLVWEDKAGEKIGGDCGNLIAHFPGVGKRALILSAHLDTVEDGDKRVKVREEQGILRSDGSTILGADCKAGLAVILDVLRAIVQEKIKSPPLDVVLTVAEEKGLLGAKNLDVSLLRATEGFILDGGELGSIIMKAPTHDSFKARFIGKASHAGIHPEEGVSAIQAAALAVSSMRLGKIDEDTTANVGIIRGGKAINIVPDEAWIEGEVRSLKKGKLEKQMREVKKACREGAKKVGAKVKFEKERLYEAFTVSRKFWLYRLTKKAARERGVQFKEIITRGGSDANIFNSAGYCCLNIGVGARNPHSVEEYVAIKDLKLAREWLLRILSLSLEEK